MVLTELPPPLPPPPPPSLFRPLPLPRSPRSLREATSIPHRGLMHPASDAQSRDASVDDATSTGEAECSGGCGGAGVGVGGGAGAGAGAGDGARGRGGSLSSCVGRMTPPGLGGRGSHSFTFQLNLSRV